MLSPSIAFQLGALFCGLSKSEGARWQTPSIDERPIVEKLNLHSPFVVSHACVGLLMELAQTPDA
jgi:hypothetical protein